MIRKFVTQRQKAKQEKELKMLAEKSKAWAVKQKEKRRAERNDAGLVVRNRFSMLTVEDGDDDEDAKEGED